MDPDLQLAVAALCGAVGGPLALRLSSWVRHRKKNDLEVAWVVLQRAFGRRTEDVVVKLSQSLPGTGIVPWNFRPHDPLAGAPPRGQSPFDPVKKED